MTDRYERIRDALAKGPTPGPWVDGPLYSVVTQDYCAGKKPVIALVELIPAKLDECIANKSLICACDPDTIRALLAERDRLREALGRILENEASDYKSAEEFGGYVLDDELRDEARAALSGEGK